MKRNPKTNKDLSSGCDIKSHSIGLPLYTDLPQKIQDVPHLVLRDEVYIQFLDVSGAGCP